MKIELSPRARKQLKKIPQREQKKIVRKLNSLSLDPLSAKSLEGEYKGLFSLRAWPYRIIYQLKKNSILILSIAHRQSAY
jgi:mRNA-degrading endonuclease RelE of RelBE toxin-antitoxin system